MLTNGLMSIHTQCADELNETYINLTSPSFTNAESVPRRDVSLSNVDLQGLTNVQTSDCFKLQSPIWLQITYLILSFCYCPNSHNI